jgi:hypothetical protein
VPDCWQLVPVQQGQKKFQQQGLMVFLPVCFLRELKQQGIQLVYFLHRKRGSLLVEVPIKYKECINK